MASENQATGGTAGGVLLWKVAVVAAIGSFGFAPAAWADNNTPGGAAVNVGAAATGLPCPWHTGGASSQHGPHGWTYQITVSNNTFDFSGANLTGATGINLGIAGGVNTGSIVNIATNGSGIGGSGMGGAATATGGTATGGAGVGGSGVGGAFNLGGVATQTGYLNGHLVFTNTYNLTMTGNNINLTGANLTGFTGINLGTTGGVNTGGITNIATNGSGIGGSGIGGAATSAGGVASGAAGIGGSSVGGMSGATGIPNGSLAMVSAAANSMRGQTLAMTSVRDPRTGVIRFEME